MGERVYDRSEIPDLIFNIYKKICNPDRAKTYQTIRAFLGQDLVDTLKKCQQEHKEI